MLPVALLLVVFQAMTVLSVPTLVYHNHQAVLDAPTEWQARLPVPNPTHSFWINTPGANPLAAEGSEGPLTSDADVCIIGSGITGVSSAYHLSRSMGDKPLKVVILEARDFCSGATGRNGGHLTPAVFLEFARYEKSFGTDEAIRSIALEQHTAAEIVKIVEAHQLEVDLVQGNHLELMITPEEVKDVEVDFAAAKAAGINMEHVQWFTKDEMEKSHGTSYPAVRFPGHNIWPLKFVTQLYNIAKNSSSNFSLNVHTRTPVTSITPTTASNRRWELSTPRGPITCSYVIHATNGYTSHLLPHLSGHSGIIPVRGTVMALRSETTLSELTTSGFSGNEGFEYWFPRPVKTPEENPLVIIGGGREVLPRYEIYLDDDSVTDKRVTDVLRDFLPGVFPGKFEQGREPEMQWTGILGFTRMLDPFVGPVLDKSRSTEKFAGQFMAAGFSGHGMPRTFGCAEALVQMIIHDMAKTTWSLPEWLPERYLTWKRDFETGMLL